MLLIRTAARQDRTAVVTEMVVAPNRALLGGTTYRSVVRNKAKLAYHGVGAWLDGKAAMPASVAAVPGMAEQLRLQRRISQEMKELRHEHGALDLRTLEPSSLEGDQMTLNSSQRGRCPNARFPEGKILVSPVPNSCVSVQASTSFTTLAPSTPVRRKSRPACR